MHNKKNIFSLITALFMLLMLVVITIFPGFAVDKNCTLSLVCTSDSKPVANLEWRAYRIGTRNSYGGFVLEGSFKKYPVSLDDMSVSAVQKNAYTLENYARLDGISANAKGVSDSKGHITLSNLQSGIYLISGTEYSTSKYRYIPSPSIIELGGEKGTNITVHPKFSVEKIPEKEKVSYSVKKVWANDESAPKARPKKISVKLYANEKLYKTINLNASNGWHYEWESDPAVSWRVTESTVVKNYTVNVGKNNTEFLIVNTYNPPQKTTSHTTVTTPKKITSPPKEELKRRVEEYEEFSEDDYTPESWKRFKKALENARRTLAYVNSTDEEIRKALEELQDAREHLVLAYESWLPQTGQLWWPVPILAGAGLVLIAVGVRVIAKKGSKDGKE